MEKPECNICGETKLHSDFVGEHGCTIRFKGGNMAKIVVEKVNGDICNRCVRLMEHLLAESKALYPDKVREAIREPNCLTQ